MGSQTGRTGRLRVQASWLERRWRRAMVWRIMEKLGRYLEGAFSIIIPLKATCARRQRHASLAWPEPLQQRNAYHEDGKLDGSGTSRA